MPDEVRHEGQPSQGQGAPQASQGQDGPKYVTQEELNQIVNSAITGRFKGFEKKFEESITGLSNTILSKVDESLTSKLEALSKPKPDGSATNPAKPKGGEVEGLLQATSIDDHPEFKKLKKQLGDIQKAAEKAEAERRMERAKARDVSLRSRIVENLTKAGIPANYAQKAVYELVDGTKRVGFENDDSERLVFRKDDGEAEDLEVGLRSWLSSDDGKLYRPPTGVQGSGDRPGQSPGRANVSDVDKALIEATRAYLGG